MRAAVDPDHRRMGAPRAARWGEKSTRRARRGPSRLTGAVWGRRGERARRVGPNHPNISTHGRAFAASTGERAEPQARREHRMWRGAHAQHAG